ncbi:MAG TPA: carbamoyltransferase HypF [Kribbella sp.]|uniref:carbamoyltransferase HypF n=1 Tax=Kribbella sp. TaxID=1871183 RepID=UPI002D78C757|nr:carbamoyltransferase HypF [Kribbella sp.]HET6295553.1 carbamoyltransferase HypF [Kribbella sp.]
MGATTDQVVRVRARITVSGVVQGVGFRPFVYALARELGLSGQVTNTPAGVIAEVEGSAGSVATFARRIASDAPPLAVVETVDEVRVASCGGTEFHILDSAGGAGRTLVSPDVATCNDCLAEFDDPADRRYRHPFITCTNCGPRFTIITGLPYDRPATTMAGFPLCADCAREYADPGDRRFHAQPIACPACGPRLSLTTSATDPQYGEEALAGARRLLGSGAILAVKGLGGFHLVCDATDEAAVTTLRKRKDRGDKPFAVMAADLATARRIAEIDETEAALLTGHRRPIVLLRRLSAAGVAKAVAPGNPDLGVMLPYTPLHRLLFEDASVLVMTSGNVSGEPIVSSDEEALIRLAPLADAWLGHDRPIHVPCDDSVARIVAGDELPIRRSRGYAPFPVALPSPVRAALAVGGDLKNTFCLGEGRYAWLSAHVGDMDDLATLTAFEKAERHLENLTGVGPEILVTDKHPAYRSRQWAELHADGRPVLGVQHHHAHLASVMAEHGYDGDEKVIGFAFDGTGYGDDGAVWGGEVLLADYDGFERYAHLGYVSLPGGDAGVRNPCRMALSHLTAAGLPWDPRLPAVQACSEEELALLRTQLERNLACAPTSSMGRLFDAVSSLAGVCHRAGYEAQAAIELEGLAAGHALDQPYEFTLSDPAPLLTAVVRDVLDGVDPGVVGARFHGGIVAAMVRTADLVRSRRGLTTVALSGGVFVNRLLLAASTRALSSAGFTVLRHRLVPPTDAGLALGQLAVAGRVHHGRS